jgi:hypothetical protein
MKAVVVPRRWAWSGPPPCCSFAPARKPLRGMQTPPHTHSLKPPHLHALLCSAGGGAGSYDSMQHLWLSLRQSSNGSDRGALQHMLRPPSRPGSGHGPPSARQRSEAGAFTLDVPGGPGEGL